MGDDIAIKVEGVSKSFKLPHEKSSSLKSALINSRRKKRGYEMQHVLKGVSFEVKKGDFFGIVGRNGSGKSTLLKLISQIYTPDEGSIAVNGKLTPFIELGVGFNPELSGRDNVYLNGALLGFSRKDMDAMYDGIVAFAELERFMDQKLKNYSSGMQVRLAFSIAIRANSDILVLDEVLAVGDEAFQRKCFSYFAELKKKKKTVILVTHSMDSVQRFCNKAILLSEGKIIKTGNPAKVAGEYLELNNEQPATTQSDTNSKPHEKNDYGVEANVDMKNSGEELMFTIDITTKERIEDAVVTMMMNSETGVAVYRWASDDTIKQDITIKKQGSIRFNIALENIFPDGKFDIQLAVKKADRSVAYALFNNIYEFRVINPDINKRDIHWKPKEKISYEQT